MTEVNGSTSIADRSALDSITSYPFSLQLSNENGSQPDEMSQADFVGDQLSTAFRRFCQKGEATEIRIFAAKIGEGEKVVAAYGDDKQTISGTFDESVSFCSEAYRIEGVSAYILANSMPLADPLPKEKQIDPILVWQAKKDGVWLDKTRHVTQKLRPSNRTTSDKDIRRRRWLVVDIDRYKGKDRAKFEGNATDEEVKHLIGVGNLILKDFPELADSAIIVDSGNGCQLLIRVEMEENYDSLLMHKALLWGLKEKYNESQKCDIDQSTTNSARLIALPGTWKCKYPPTEGRPWRMVRFIKSDKPTKIFELTQEWLEKTFPGSIEAAKTKNTNSFAKIELSEEQLKAVEKDFSLKNRIELAMNWVDEVAEEATSRENGGDGRNRLSFEIARDIVWGFALPQDFARKPFEHWNSTKCDPPLDDNDFEQKLTSAANCDFPAQLGWLIPRETPVSAIPLQKKIEAAEKYLKNKRAAKKSEGDDVNKKVYSVAIKLWEIGLDEANLLKYLKEYNSKCEPTLEEKQLIKKIRRIMENKPELFEKFWQKTNSCFDYLMRKSDNMPFENETNIIRVLSRENQFDDQFWYDEFYGRKTTRFSIGNLPKPDAPRVWIDSDDTHIQIMVQEMIFPTVSLGKIQKCVDYVAHSRTKSSAREWLLEQQIHDDNQNRAEMFWQDFCGAEDSEYTRACGRNFWIGLAACLLEPGRKLDEMQILEGDQGIGKSTLLRNIAGDDWYLDLKADFDHEDRTWLEKTAGKLIVEIGELAAICSKKSSVEAVKRAITNQVDVFRTPYDRYAMPHRRQFLFVGTTNKYDYLIDDENRRFMPIKCHFADFERIKKERLRYFAEGLRRYQNGEKWHLYPIEEAKAIQKSRRQSDCWEDKILPFIENKENVRVWDILEEIDPLGKKTPQDEKRVKDILRFHGWESGRQFRIDGKNCKGWGRKSKAQKPVRTSLKWSDLDYLNKAKYRHDLHYFVSRNEDELGLPNKQENPKEYALKFAQAKLRQYQLIPETEKKKYWEQLFSTPDYAAAPPKIQYEDKSQKEINEKFSDENSKMKKSDPNLIFEERMKKEIDQMYSEAFPETDEPPPANHWTGFKNL